MVTYDVGSESYTTLVGEMDTYAVGSESYTTLGMIRYGERIDG